MHILSLFFIKTSKQKKTNKKREGKKDPKGFLWCTRRYRHLLPSIAESKDRDARKLHQAEGIILCMLCSLTTIMMRGLILLCLALMGDAFVVSPLSTRVGALCSKKDEEVVQQKAFPVVSSRQRDIFSRAAFSRLTSFVSLYL